MTQTANGIVKDCTGLIYDIRHGSETDGPGVRTTVLFKGCSFSCAWCANPELQSAAVELMFNRDRCLRCGNCISTCLTEAAQDIGSLPAQIQQVDLEREECLVCGACISGCEGVARALVGSHMSVDQVMAALALEVADGVTLAGGEPFIQGRFLEALLQACQARGIHTAVDTSGYMPWEKLERARPWVDLFLVELKFIDSARHEEFTGLPNAIILENIRALSAAGHPLILRVPVIPRLNDDLENQAAIAAFAAQLPRLDGVELLPYHRPAENVFTRLGKPYHPLGGADFDPAVCQDLEQLYRRRGLNARVCR